MIETRLSRLSAEFLPTVEQFLSLLTQQRIYVVVIETLRTPKRQQELYDDGRSETLNSLHLSGNAIDLAPVRYYDGRVREINWNTSDPLWSKIGSLGESLGLEWGGRWESFPDFVHFQKGDQHEKATSSADAVDSIILPQIRVFSTSRNRT